MNRFMLCDNTGFSAQPAVLRQEGQCSSFPKKEEIVCMCIHVHERAQVQQLHTLLTPLLIGRTRHALVPLVAFAIFLSLVSYGISLLYVVFSSSSIKWSSK